MTLQTACGPLWVPDFRSAEDPADVTDKLRITWHWSAGTYDLNQRAREHYHVTGDRNGRAEQGVPIADQIATKKWPRLATAAAHVKNGNSNNIGVSALGMHGAQESEARRGNYGPYPLTPQQVEFLVEITAQLCHFYGIPVIPARVLGHAEWRTVLGIHQDRWDVCCIPHLDIRPHELPDGTFESHNYLRSRVKQRVADLSRGTVSTGEIEVLVAKLVPHLRELYAITDQLPLSAQDKQLAKRNLNQFNNLLVTAGIRPATS